MISGEAAPKANSKAARSLWQEFVVLFKLRIVVLLLFAAMGGAFLASAAQPNAVHRWPDWPVLLLVLVCGGLAAAGSSALNEYIERDRDALMARTRKRPLVTGALGTRVGWVLAVALAMIVAPVLAVLPSNPPLSAALAAGAFIYVVVYTLWLKPRTALNIVIGGAAGSAAVLSGSAAAGDWANPAALGLAVLLFLWTPIHFWALALVYREDYAKAGIPMLPVRAAPRIAAAWGLVHGVGAAAVAVLLTFLKPVMGPVYFVPAFLASAALIYEGVQLVRHPVKRVAWRLFHTSNLFLFLILLAICLDSFLYVPWPF